MPRQSAARLVTLVWLLCALPAYAQLTENRTDDPGKAEFVVQDILHFIDAYELLVPGADTLAILRSEYFDRASPGLFMFVEKYDLTPERLRNAIRRYPEDYASIHLMPGLLAANDSTFRSCYRRLKAVIPQAVFPPTYFLVGAHRGIGSGSKEGPLISIEKERRSSIGTSMNAFLVHEMVHLQQVEAIGLDKYLAIFGPEKSLLALTIREGIAEFFADMAVGEITQEEAREYVIVNEASLWRKFQPDMMGAETGDWMWATPSDPSQPRHVAYYLGARIVQSYYDRASNKMDAVAEILSVTDYPAFLSASGYADKFQ